MIDSVNLSDNKFSTELFFEKAKLFFNLSKFNILHIGAYLGEEVDIYKRYTENKIYLVEGNSRIFLKLKKKFYNKKKIYLLNKVISGKPVKKNFFIYKFRDSFKSSSLLEIDHLKKVTKTYSGVEAINVQTSSINDILNKIDILILDTQGTELEILKSIKKKFFSRLKLIIVEENHKNNYKMQSNPLMIKNFLKNLKFIKVLKIKYEYYNKTKYYPAWSDNMYINFSLKKKSFITKYYKFYKSKF